METFHKLLQNPKRVFLLDALGALLTTVMLWGVLRPFEEYFGMPSSVLKLLAGVAFCFFVYSISCHRLLSSRWKLFLSILITLNTLYCVVSIAFMIIHLDLLTPLGLMYFILEIAVISIVIFIEYKTYVTQD